MKRSLLLICTLVIALVGCEKEEATVPFEGPYFALEATTLDFVPYSETATLSFKNDKEEELILTIQEAIKDTVWNYSKNGEHQIHYSEFRRLRLVGTYKNGNHCQFLIDMNVSVPNAAPYDLADFLSIDYSNSLNGGGNTTHARLGFDLLTSTRGKQVDSRNFWGTRDAIFYETLVLANTSYANAYMVKDNAGLELYYSKTIGIIAFQDLNRELWIVDRME